MSIDNSREKLTRYVLNGATMGTRYSAILYAADGLDTAPLETALFEAVDRVDRQMSTWKPESDLMRLNGSAVGEWVKIPEQLMHVLQASLDMGKQSDGAFDIGLGDLIDAWGFGAARENPDVDQVTAHLGKSRKPAHEMLELDAKRGQARRLDPVQLDLSGIAKGFAVDEMLHCVAGFGIKHALVSLDGELRAIGQQGATTPWSVAVEFPGYDSRSALGVITLENASIATSGDYRHWVEVGETRLSHTMNRRLGGPVSNSLASVTVIAPDCMSADAWATVLLVLGDTAGPALARAKNMTALFLVRRNDEIEQIAVGGFSD